MSRYQKTRIPQGMTPGYYTTKNMPVELITQARRIAALRQAAGMKGATIESVIIDCLVKQLPALEATAEARVKTK